MENDEEQIKSLIAGGTIGAALGALITERGGGTIIGAIAGAAIFASIKAQQTAAKVGVPIVIEKDDALYQRNPDGTEIFIKHLSKNNLSSINKKFILK